MEGVCGTVAAVSIYAGNLRIAFDLWPVVGVRCSGHGRRCLQGSSLSSWGGVLSRLTFHAAKVRFTAHVRPRRMGLRAG